MAFEEVIAIQMKRLQRIYSISINYCWKATIGAKKKKKDTQMHIAGFFHYCTSKYMMHKTNMCNDA